MGKGKKYTDASGLVDPERLHPTAEALELVKSTSKRNFDEGVDVVFRLGIDPRKAEQMVRGTVSLPNGTGGETRVAVFAEGDEARAAESAGADVVGADDLVERVEGGFLDFDVAIATPPMMGKVGKLGRVLGPRGLMPNPKTGTVTPDVAQAVEEFKAGKVEYRTDKAGNVHVPIGKVSFSADELAGNYEALLAEITRVRPSAIKGHYIKGITISATMGPGIRVDPDQE